jgi:catechol 2,3-dioxygenase-like lactoylglutathione lyase family enzyme
VYLSLNRIILYVQNVQMLTGFYRDVLGLSVVEEIPNEWVVLRCGPSELALHRAGEAFRVSDASAHRLNSNAKLVMTVHGDLTALREKLIAQAVPMGEIKSYPAFTGPLCDGIDPEGNVFQLAEARA